MPDNYPALDKRFTLTEAEEQAFQLFLNRQEQGENLKPEEGEYFDSLATRRHRRADLDDFRKWGEVGAFGDWQGIAPDMHEHNNLPAKIKAYEQAKQHRTTPASIKALAVDELARQSDLKDRAIREANLYYGADADKYQIKLDFIEQVYAAFQAHVERDRAQLSGFSTKEPLITVPSIGRGKKPQAGTPTGVRSPESLDEFFTWKFNTTHCDRLAKMAELCPPDRDFDKVSNAHTKIWAVVKAIKSGGYSSVSEGKLAKELGRRYGYMVANKLTNVSKNAELSDILTNLKHHITLWKDSGELK